MRFEGITDSRFEIQGLLGKGGCGAVYQAYDRETRRSVALKVLNPEKEDAVSVARLAREARAAYALNHPNVCSLYAAGLLDDGRPYVAMELLKGMTLRSYLELRGSLTVEESIEIGVQILSGLEEAHAIGLVHRDVKPENVFLVEEADGRIIVKLLDFGLCRRAEDPVDCRTLTIAGSVVGTPGYLAPEQVTGNRAIDPRVDIFGVGLILFEMLAGRRAYRGKNVVQLVTALLSKDVPFLCSLKPSIPVSLACVVAFATKRDPNARYRRAAHFLHDLLEARTTIRREGSRSAQARALARSGHDDDSDWDIPTREQRVA